jgi:hypothetical protein
MIKHLFKLGARHMVVDGRRTMFWLDKWHGAEPLRTRFPGLFDICDDPTVSVAQVCGEPSAMRFRRSLDPGLRAVWLELVVIMDSVQLREGADLVIWDLEPSGVFSVHSMYAKLSQGAAMFGRRNFP